MICESVQPVRLEGSVCFKQTCLYTSRQRENVDVSGKCRGEKTAIPKRGKINTLRQSVLAGINGVAVLVERKCVPGVQLCACTPGQSQCE